MANINLTTQHEEKEKLFPYKKGLVVIVLILLLISLVYGWLYLSEQQIKAQVMKEKEVYSQEHAKLSGESSLEVVDFQNRLSIAKKFSGERHLAMEVLMEMEKSMLPEVFADSLDFEHDGQKVVLMGAAPDFKVVAEQILKFKNSHFFSDASPVRALLRENGKVSFTVELTIK